MLKKTHIQNKNAKSGVDVIYEDDQNINDPSAPEVPVSSSRIDAAAQKTTKSKLKQKYLK
ncbi:hypothetical protein [Marinibactrum halimedae]|uniref:Uncharacterized protein n=1 Tax=Marinibactrum halimedae TaxID=1444977 RepID=A0AA37WP85_9GAMM|nr:hypothetical protein [Marinibactrum halimedae]MCD9460027.1 hypothetical protein [Marinibactrum halimedae]GLS28205.1 hypothetical protein GCM10007877_39240 [Marinibactrum halimedae]